MISLLSIIRLLLKSIKASVFSWHEKFPTVKVVKSYILKGNNVSGV